MSEEKVMIPLTKGKKNAVIIGCVVSDVFRLLFLELIFLSFRDRYLAEMHASQYYSLLTIFASLGVGDYDADRRKTW